MCALPAELPLQTFCIHHGPSACPSQPPVSQVVAVPEGLPLAVTISLAYSMKKMMKVRAGLCTEEGAHRCACTVDSRA